MAYKTPGIYFSEIDNTDFTNPAASINTTVAIIGFAKKGPIGTPIEIRTYNDYKSIFGTPISGQYSGLAVRSVLSSGGTVLFTRIADESIATKSNVVLKNGTEAIDGSVVINKASDITVGTVGYDFAKTYAGVITSPSGIKKTLFIRTPSEGKLKLTNMLAQFKQSLADTYGRAEFSIGNIVSNSSIRNFNISVYDSENEQYKNVGPFFVNVKGSDNSSGSVNQLVNDIQKALDSGTNAYQKIYVFGNKNGKLNVENGWANANVNIGEQSKVTLQFSYTYVNNETTTSNTKRIEINGVAQDDNSYIIYMNDVATALTEALEKQSIYVKWCFNNEDAKIQDSDSENGATQGYLLFVNTNGTNAIDINPRFNVVDEQGRLISDSLFTPIKAVEADGKQPYYFTTDVEIDPAYGEYLTFNSEKEIGVDDYTALIKNGEPVQNYQESDDEYETDENGDPIPTGEVDENGDPIYKKKKIYTSTSVAQLNGLFVCKQKCVNGSKIDNIANVSYDKNTSTLIFEASSVFNVEGSRVELSKTSFGSYLFNDNDIVEAKELNYNDDTLYLFNDNEKNIGKYSASFVGENASNLTVFIKNNQINFVEEGNTIPSEIITKPSEDAELKEALSGYEDISLLIGDPITEKEFNTQGWTNTYPCVVYKEGSAELDPSKRDIIVFTSREYGEGTSNVGIRIYTSTSPLDNSKTHYIETVINGVVKETWEDVSYNPSSERYFENLLNEEPENAGSSYVRVKVIKNDTTQEDVMVPDTSELTGSTETPIYLGKAYNSECVERTKDVSLDSYLSYDYSVGDNGVPEDTSDLFMEAMDTTNSGLSNKDLYTWHILITPDNISEEVQDTAINLCEFMEDAIYIADPPQGISRENVVKWHNGAFGRGSALQSDYACTYWPWLKVYDSNESKYVWCMPSVLMAAQFCKVDNNYAPWYAPAGETNGLISQAVDIEKYPNKNDRDEMYLDQNRVNPFLMQKNGNILAYGEKTLKRKNSTLTKIHTRRMLISLKHELRNSIKGFIFMPTMTENITKIRGIATSIMERAKTGGGVSSYTVICDETNNTIETLQQDILNLAVVCTPNGCIEQVEISFTLNKSES